MKLQKMNFFEVFDANADPSIVVDKLQVEKHPFIYSPLQHNHIITLFKDEK
jgi:hypothetical protein